MTRPALAESVYRPRRSRRQEAERQSDILLTIMQLLASVDAKLEGICAVLAVPVDDPPGGDVVPIRPKPGQPG